MILVWGLGLAGLALVWKKTVVSYEAGGVSVPDDMRELTGFAVVSLNIRRHTIGWSLFFFSLFLIMALLEMPVWARLGLLLCLGVYYGSVRLDREEAQETQFQSFPFAEPINRGWLFLIATLEWCGYLGVLLFAAAVVNEALV
jgi:hypothetical protein